MKEKIFEIVKSPWLYLFLLIGLFLMIKMSTLTFRFSDGNAYLYMADLLKKGVLPYRDFFYAHPLGHLLFLLPFAAVSGSDPLFMNMTPFFLGAVSAVFVYLISKNYFSPGVALASAAAFLFSLSTLEISDFPTGVELATALLLASIWCASEERYAAAGVLSGLAMASRFYSAPVIAGIMLAIVIRDRKKLLRYLAPLTAVLAGFVIVPLVYAPREFIDQAFVYHFKKSEVIPKERIVRLLFFNDWLLIGMFLAGAVVLVRKKIYLLLAPGLCVAAFYLFFVDIYFFYLMVLLPFLALGFAASAHAIVAGRHRAVSFIAAIVLGFFMTKSASVYIAHESREAAVDDIQAMVAHIRENTAPADTLYGSVTITPLLSLLSKRALAGNFVDTNTKVFSTNTISLHQRLDELKRLKLRLFITPVMIDPGNKIRGLTLYGTEDFFNRYCTASRVFPLSNYPGYNALIIWDCRF